MLSYLHSGGEDNKRAGGEMMMHGQVSCMGR